MYGCTDVCRYPDVSSVVLWIELVVWVVRQVLQRARTRLVKAERVCVPI